MTAQEYKMLTGLVDAQDGSYEEFCSVVNRGPMFTSKRFVELFEYYLFGYVMGLGERDLL